MLLLSAPRAALAARTTEVGTAPVWGEPTGVTGAIDGDVATSALATAPPGSAVGSTALSCLSMDSAGAAVPDCRTRCRMTEDAGMPNACWIVSGVGRSTCSTADDTAAAAVSTPGASSSDCNGVAMAVATWLRAFRLLRTSCGGDGRNDTVSTSAPE